MPWNKCIARSKPQLNPLSRFLHLEHRVHKVRTNVLRSRFFVVKVVEQLPLLTLYPFELLFEGLYFFLKRINGRFVRQLEKGPVWKQQPKSVFFGACACLSPLL
mmetsp:Transcript_790/g.4927  ORF Transcript_790/g.4927 Transcript_790/m.4927 type:complete len:104 (+) Transcript_790:619-930(+)